MGLPARGPPVYFKKIGLPPGSAPSAPPAPLRETIRVSIERRFWAAKEEVVSAFSRVAPGRGYAHGVRMKMRLIVSDPEILGGTPVFAGTRVPVKNLTDCLEAGDSIDDFLEDFPSVSRAQVIEFLEEARAQLTANVA